MLSTFLLASRQTHAQENELESLSLEALLNVRITTASKMSQSTGEAPATVLVITGEQIRTRGYKNLAEVLNDLPDMKVNDKSDPQHYNTINVRGIQRQDKFVILLDGIRISSPTNEPLPLLENYPIYLAKQIEVVYGPGSALYGADAMSGVINIITENRHVDHLRVTSSAGTQGYSNASIWYTKPLKDDFTLSFGAQYNYDGQPNLPKLYKDEFSMRSHQTGVFNSIYGVMRPDQPLDSMYSAPIQTHNLYLGLNKGGFDFKILSHYSRVPSSSTLRPEEGVYNKDVFYGQGVTTANMSYTDSIGLVKSTTAIQGSFYHVNPKSNFRNLNSRMEHGYKYGFGSMLKADQQLSFDLSHQISLMTGVTAELFESMPKSVELQQPFNRLSMSSPILLNSTDVYNPGGITANVVKVSYSNIGMFIQSNVSPIKQLNITLGARYDHNSRFGATFNPRLGVVYRPAKGTIVKAMYGTAYWAPSPHVAYEKYGAFYSLDSGRSYQSAYWHLPNPNLKPITSHTTEFSVNQKLNKQLNATITAYFTHNHGVIANVNDNGSTNLYNNTHLGYPVGYIEVPINEGLETLYGGNLMVTGTFDIGAFDFNAWSSLGYTNGTIEQTFSSNKVETVEVPYISPWQFKIGLDGRLNRFNFSIRAINYGEQRVTGFENYAKPNKRQVLPGYTLVNASTGYTFRDKLNLFINVQNLLDVRYRSPLNVDLQDPNAMVFRGGLQDPIRGSGGIRLEL